MRGLAIAAVVELSLAGVQLSRLEERMQVCWASRIFSSLSPCKLDT